MIALPSGNGFSSPGTIKLHFMNYFVGIVRTLKGKQKLLLLKRIRSQPLKLKLFNYVVENDETDNESLNSFLGQGKNFSSLYTLKNRLLDDIIAVKQEFITHEVVKVKEQVQHLTLLLASGENEILQRELKKLERSALRYELTTELTTIYYCYYLISDAKKRDKYLKQLENLNKKTEVAFELDKLFYTRILHAQELFYFSNKRLLDELRTIREKVNYYHSQLQSQTSRFYLLFTDVVLSLSGNELFTEQAAQAFKQLQQLSKLYLYSFLKRTMPMGQMAIDCLYLRFYYLTNNNTQFNILQRGLYPDIMKLQKHYLFDCCFTVFAMHIVYDSAKQGKAHSIIAQLSKIIKEESITQLPNNYNAHAYYLLALKEYHLENYAGCSSLLIKGRSCPINPASAWILFEITLLSLLTMLHRHEYLYIEHEINLLRRYFVKYKIEAAHIKALNPLFKTLREFEKTQDMCRVKNAVNRVCEETGLMKLIATATVPESISH